VVPLRRGTGPARDQEVTGTGPGSSTVGMGSRSVNRGSRLSGLGGLATVYTCLFHKLVRGQPVASPGGTLGQRGHRGVSAAHQPRGFEPATLTGAAPLAVPTVGEPRSMRGAPMRLSGRGH
jgi:hypothetical protein